MLVCWCVGELVCECVKVVQIVKMMIFGLHQIYNFWNFYLSFCSLQEGIYGAYTKVSHYRAWIEEKMINPKFCSGGADAWSTI